MTDIEQRIAELERKIQILEENQKAIDGAIGAFITVFAVRRLPEEEDT